MNQSLFFHSLVERKIHINIPIVSHFFFSWENLLWNIFAYIPCISFTVRQHYQKYLFLKLIVLCHMQDLSSLDRILVPWPGIEPMPLEVEAWSLNHWTSREVPEALLFHTPQRKITVYHVNYDTRIFFLLRWLWDVLQFQRD